VRRGDRFWAVKRNNLDPLEALSGMRPKLAGPMTAEREEPAPRPHSDSWTLQHAVDELFDIHPESARGVDRLGRLAFDDAPAQLKHLRTILTELAREEWHRLPVQLRAGIEGQLIAVLDTFSEMSKLSSDAHDAAAAREDLAQRLTAHTEWFSSEVWPHCVTARVEAALLSREAGEAGAETRERLRAIRDDLNRLDDERARLAEAIKLMQPVVDAQREVVVASGVEQLGVSYVAEATKHRESWTLWLKWLIASVVIAVIGGVVAVVAAHPDEDAGNGEIISALAVELLIIGLLLYVVRMASLQFRVHRHLETVATNKANALATFNRMVAGQTEADVRVAVAGLLAQAVFSSDESGFIDASADHVTLIERVVGPAVQRLSA
jgi:hypothetical protein